MPWSKLCKQYTFPYDLKETLWQQPYERTQQIKHNQFLTVSLQVCDKWRHNLPKTSRFMTFIGQGSFPPGKDTTAYSN